MESRGHYRPMVSIEKAADAAFSMLFYLIFASLYGLRGLVYFQNTGGAVFFIAPMRPAVPRDQKLWRKDANFANEIASRCSCLLCLI